MNFWSSTYARRRESWTRSCAASSSCLGDWTSDARNGKIFNIFSLVRIGERSGMGLSSLYGVWEKERVAEPSIVESYEPDRTKVMVEFEADDSELGAKTPEVGVETAELGVENPEVGVETSEVGVKKTEVGVHPDFDVMPVIERASSCSSGNSRSHAPAGRRAAPAYPPRADSTSSRADGPSQADRRAPSSDRRT